MGVFYKNRATMATMPNNKHTWNLRALYESDDDPQIEKDLSACRSAYEAFAKRWHDELGLVDNRSKLLSALEEWEKLNAEYGYDGKAGYYFRLRSSQEVTNPTIRAKLNLTANEAKRNADAVRFFVLRIGQATQEQKATILADPTLAHFYPYLRQIFAEAAHSLSEGEERVFSYLIEPAYSKWAEMVEGFLSSEQRSIVNESGATIACNYSDLDRFLTSPSAEVRHSAVTAVNSILSAHVATAENELNAILETKKANDLLRHYTEPESERLLADTIDPTVVQAMCEAVRARFDIPQRFYRMKASLLKVPKLLYGERNVPYGSLPDDYSYERSVALVERSLIKLDPEFGRILSGFVQGGQIDVFPRTGKRSGAFCAYDRIDLPTYILLNHTNTLRDLTTLAHEVGHGINDELIKQKQTALYASTPLSTAEVASTFFEDFALHEVIAELDDTARLSVLIAKLNDDIATIFRQVAAFSFEQDLHRSYRRQGYLSKEQIGEMFQKHMTAYLGEAVKFDDEARNWWVGWHHFRRPFYVYSYASGLLISKGLQQIVANDPKAIALVKDFLASGTSRPPKEIFLSLGIDISNPDFWFQGITMVEATLTEAESLARSMH